MSVAGSKSGLRYSPKAITWAEVNRDMSCKWKNSNTRSLDTSHYCHTHTQRQHIT